jgi:hypothetical protein
MTGALLTLAVRAAVAGGLAVAAAACAGAAPRVSPGAPAAAAPRVEPQLVGRWELVTFEVERAGARTVRMARGELTYDEFATISVRVELLPTDAAAAPPRIVVLDFTAKAAADLARGEVTYVGLQARTPSERLAPDAVAADDWRRVAVEGEVLRLTAERADGSASATLTWRRVGR